MTRRVTMKKLILPVLCILSILLLAEGASALFPSGRDLMRLQLMHRSPDAGPIYFRGGLISNIYGDLPAKYSPQNGQIYFPHYNLGPYGQLAYRPSDYIIYGSAFGNPGVSAGFAGYYPEQSYGTYNYNGQQYLPELSSYGSAYRGYPYASFGYPYGYGGYGLGYGGYGYGGYNGYSLGNGMYNGANFGGNPYGSNIYTGYESNIYPGPFGTGGDYPLNQQMPAGWTNPNA